MATTNRPPAAYFNRYSSLLRQIRATHIGSIVIAVLLSVLGAEATPVGLSGDSANRIHDSKYRTEIVTVTIEPGEELEYVLDIEQGEPLLYSWRTDSGNIYSDFHGAPEDKESYPDDYWIRYEKSTDEGAHGALVSPFTGHTAWFWVNKSDRSIRITLELAGYFSDNRIEFRRQPEE